MSAALPAGGGALGAPERLRGDRRAKAFVDFQNDVCVKDINLAVQEGHALDRARQALHHDRHGDRSGQASNMNALAIAAAVQGKSIPEVGLTTFSPPFTPVTFGTFAGHSRGELFDPVRRTPMHDKAAASGAVFEDVGLWKRAWYFPQVGESMHEAVDYECRTMRADAGLFDAFDARQDRGRRPGCR